MIDAFEPRLVDEDEVVIKQVRFDPNQTDLSTPHCVPTKPGMITRRSHAPMRRSAVSGRQHHDM